MEFTIQRLSAGGFIVWSKRAVNVINEPLFACSELQQLLKWLGEQWGPRNPYGNNVQKAQAQDHPFAGAMPSNGRHL